jgi:hypothetical protein
MISVLVFFRTWHILLMRTHTRHISTDCAALAVIVLSSMWNDHGTQSNVNELRDLKGENFTLEVSTNNSLEYKCQNEWRLLQTCLSSEVLADICTFLASMKNESQHCALVMYTKKPTITVATEMMPQYEWSLSVQHTTH